MTVQPSGTDAKDISLYFAKATDQKPNTPFMQKSILQAKNLLKSYSKEQIIKVIDIALKDNPSIYSLGYINFVIVQILKNIATTESKETTSILKQEIASELASQQVEVKPDNSSRERNRTKLDRFGVQPRFGKELDFDLFKE